MNKNARIYLSGHTGLVGSALYRHLKKNGFAKVLTRSHAELDLRDQAAVNRFFEDVKPEYVILAAARVGGIYANSAYPADFLYDNIMIGTNVIHAAYKTGVHKLLNLGSSCIYPRLAPQPLKEEYLLTGPLESTNRAYAVAKIAAVELCDYYRAQYGCDFISAMPTNVYGPNDNFDLTTSHVLPALIRKFHEAKVTKRDAVEIWGTGSPRREFIYADDLADAIFFLMAHFSAPGPINVGTGLDVTINELATLISQIVEFRGRLVYDDSKSDGTPRKLLDISKLKELGWTAHTQLAEGIRQTYDWFVNHRADIHEANLAAKPHI